MVNEGDCRMTRPTAHDSRSCQTSHEFWEKFEAGKYYFNVIFFIYLINGVPAFTSEKPDTDTYVHVTHELLQGTVIAHLTGHDGAYRYIDMAFSPDMPVAHYRERVINEAVDMLEQKKK